MRCVVITAAAIALWLMPPTAAAEGDQASQYAVPAFGYRVKLPDGWSIYRENEGETRAVVSFGLPKVWSQLEQQNIENAVSVSAYKREDLATIQDVVDFELQRISHILVSSEEVDIEYGKALQKITEIKGVSYKSLTTFRIENNVAYVFGFTATEGTYDLNLERFFTFLETVEFFEPEATPAKIYESKFEEALAVYRDGPSRAYDVITLLEKELEENPENLKAIKLLGITYFGIERFEDALKQFDRALSVGGDVSPHMQLYKARTLHELGRNEEAQQILTVFWAFFQDDGDLESQYEQLSSAIEAELSEE